MGGDESLWQLFGGIEEESWRGCGGRGYGQFLTVVRA